MDPKKKPVRRGFFSDDFEEVLNRMMKKMLKDFEGMEGMFDMPLEGANMKNPLVYGFSMRVGPDGKPQFQQFGNTHPTLKGAQAEREPLVDVIPEKETITVIAELPGVTKEDIHVKATEETLSIKVDTAERKYSKTLKLPAEVKPETARAKYKNGVLEVKIERVKKEEEKPGKEVKVD